MYQDVACADLSMRPSCGLLHLHEVVAAAASIHHGDEAHDRPLLVLSKKQCCHQQECKPPCRREDRGMYIL